ncbi:AAA family ATPase, partial [uncultured Bacteroides sp.]|uniref:ATP-dependent DNA helicase n=1 Tax=uncultured Bacteroides sp. TaxID=162156 RepID=UPI0025AFB11E
AVKFLADFLFSRQSDSVFLLKGYAGTGKTSLIGALVKTLDQLQQKCVLLAPTGRAAKVFSHYAQHPAYTIHKKIYRQRNFSNDLDNFSLDDNLHQHTLFIVDEASMIANDGLSGAVFGTGRLLDDLIQYVYSGTGCRLMLIGDTAQLPPVGEEESPALSADRLRGYGMEVYEAQLTEVVRQMHDSGILWNATELRRYISEEDFFTLPSVRVEGFPDIRTVSGSELIEVINDCYGQTGMDETIVVCRSNKRANIYNRGIRNTILYREDELNSGDLLMVAKNNYFWTEGCKEMDFIANGDIAVVRRVRRTREAYGFRFADVVLAFPDYDDMELEVKLLLDTLHTDTPALPKELNDKLFYSVLEDYADIAVKRERMKKMKADPHYNALQVKYAYAVTCHKAQGGQWKRVFLDQGYMTEDMLTPDYFRWLYTAFTRATEILYLVNWPKEQME